MSSNPSVLGWIRPLIRLTKYESHLIGVTARLFGTKKALLFILALPLVFFSRQNRSAYELMGECRMVISGQEVRIIHPDVRFIEEILLNKCYTPDSSFEIQDDSIVIDAGANVGIYTIYAGTRARHGKVIAIEPEMRNFTFLRENISANGFSNVELENSALAESDGEARLHLSRAGSHSIMPQDSLDDFQVCESVSVDTILKRYSLNHVDILKLDIEGTEFSVLESTPWIKGVGKIVMEIHSRYGRPQTIVDTLSYAGFQTRLLPSVDSGTYYLHAKRSLGSHAIL
jgi:FkbM family methyltransferase